MWTPDAFGICPGTWCEEGSRLIGGTCTGHRQAGAAQLWGGRNILSGRVMGKVRARCYRTDGLGRD